MLMADNSYCDVNPPVDDILLRDVNDDDEQDRLYFDMDSLWNMIGDTPEVLLYFMRIRANTNII